MPISNNILAGSGQGGAADLGEPIEQSLRFTGDTRLVASTTGPTGNFTISFWWKRALGTTATHTLFMFEPNQAYQFSQGNSDTFAARVSTFDFLSDGSLRDHSAWYHVVLVNNGGTTTMYLNGVRQVDTATTPSGTSQNMTIGSNNDGLQDDRLVGYLAEYNLFDGTLLTADDFGRYNSDGVWVPKKIDGEFTSAQYGAKGFRLTFDSTQHATASTGIGIDSAPTGTGHTSANNFTATGLNTTAGHIDYSIDFKDTPTNNIPTLNWISSGAGGNLEKANLKWATSGPSVGVVSAGHSISSGKWYWEVDISTQGSGFGVVGIRHIQHSNRRENDLGSFATDYSYRGDGTKRNNGGGSSYGASYTTGDRIGVAFDGDAGTLEFFKNNVSQGVAFTGIEGEYLPSIGDQNTGSVFQGDVDFGQKPFEFTPPTGYQEISTDNFEEPVIKDPSKHFEVIRGTGTAGFLVYPQPNSPTPTATSAADFTSETPVAVTSSFTSGVSRQAFVFDTISEITNTAIDIDSQSGGFWGGRTVNAYVSATGAADSWTQVVTNQVFDATAANTVTIPAQTASYRYIKLLADITSNASWATSDGTPILTHAQNTFTSGLYMIKPDASSQVFYYIDPINGTNAAHRVPLPTSTAAYTPFNGTAYAWMWNCPDTFTATGITSGRRNVDAGFSVVKYTGDDTNPRSIPHGLGRKVGWVILWNPNANDTTCFITGLPGTGTNTENLIWNTAEGASNLFSAGTQHTPTDVNNFIVGNSAGGSGVTGVNANGVSYTAFCWAPVPGYSIMGTYPGDNDPDGRFIHCGFRPKWVLIKSQGADHWYLYDTLRDPANPCDRVFLTNDNGPESNGGGNADIDILSNGFKLRGDNAAMNGSNNYNYVAFAESPFGGANVAPATAR